MSIIFCVSHLLCHQDASVSGKRHNNRMHFVHYVYLHDLHTEMTTTHLQAVGRVNVNMSVL